MDKIDTDIAYQVKDRLLEAFEQKPALIEFPVKIDNHPRFGLSLSAAGKQERCLAHIAKGSPRKDRQARSMANMDMGTIAHDYVRFVLASHPDIEMTDAERTVTLTIVSPDERDPGEDLIGSIKGHIDGFIKTLGYRILFDIKTVDHYSFNEMDPRNPETNWWAKGRKWAAGNYVFDAVKMFENQLFKSEYLPQVACYEAALIEEGEDWDFTVFILYNRNTSHIAIGSFSPKEERWDALVGEAKERIATVLLNPDPFSYVPCHPAAVGASPETACQYCDFLEECFQLETTIFRGKPRYTIMKIN